MPDQTRPAPQPVVHARITKTVANPSYATNVMATKNGNQRQTAALGVHMPPIVAGSGGRLQ